MCVFPASVVEQPQCGLGDRCIDRVLVPMHTGIHQQRRRCSSFLLAHRDRAQSRAPGSGRDLCVRAWTAPMMVRALITASTPRERLGIHCHCPFVVGEQLR
jgi:hypothetical protein